MALEPVVASADDQPTPELLDMTRRFWIGLALTLPVFGLAMASTCPACTRCCRTQKSPPGSS